MTSSTTNPEFSNVIVLNDSSFLSGYDIHSRIFPGNEIFLSAQQSVLAKGVKAHEQYQGP